MKIFGVIWNKRFPEVHLTVMWAEDEDWMKSKGVCRYDNCHGRDCILHDTIGTSENTTRFFSLTQFFYLHNPKITCGICAYSLEVVTSALLEENYMNDLT